MKIPIIQSSNGFEKVESKIHVHYKRSQKPRVRNLKNTTLERNSKGWVKHETEATALERKRKSPISDKLWTDKLKQEGKKEGGKRFWI